MMYYYDMRTMTSVRTRVLEMIAGLPEGEPISAKALLHLGTRQAVDQALSRLCRGGQLLRGGRGLYLKPVQTRFGARPPAAPRVLSQLAERTGEIIVPSGAAAANVLGLTTQVPTREVYLTSGATRRLKLGAQTIELRHAPRWQLSLPGNAAGEAIRALTWLGPDHGVAAISHLSTTLPSGAIHDLLAARVRLPEWLAREVSALAAHV